MADEAYDIEIGLIVSAENCVSKPKGTYICHLKCKEKGVSTPVYLRTTDGENMFVSYKDCPHVPNCNFPIKQTYRNAFDPKFTRESLMDRLLHTRPKFMYQPNHHSAGDTLEHSKRATLKWLYNVCIHNDNDFEFAPGCTVESSCVKEGTLDYWRNKDISQYPLLFIGTIKRYDRSSSSLIFNFMTKELELVFEEYDCFNAFIDRCKKKNTRTPGTNIYAFGYIKPSDNFHFQMNITSHKQIGISD